VPRAGEASRTLRVTQQPEELDRGGICDIFELMSSNPAPQHRDEAVDGLLRSLRSLPSASDDAGRISRLRALEELKAAAAALQASETAAFVASQRAAQAAAGIKPERVGRGIAAQVGLALRVSPHRAQRYVGWSMILTRELPETFAALAGLG